MPVPLAWLPPSVSLATSPAAARASWWEPKGEVEISEGVIAAKRHIHMTPADAEEMGVKDKDVVSVKLNTPERALTFGDVVVRVSDKFALAMHIDTDESNAACCGRDTMGEIVK